MMLIDEIQNKVDMLTQSIKALKNTSQRYAEAERDYKILLRNEALKLKTEGMAIGMISLTVYGIPEVALARMKRDIAEATYKANHEAIQAYKLELRLMDSQAQREWSVAE